MSGSSHRLARVVALALIGLASALAVVVVVQWPGSDAGPSGGGAVASSVPQAPIAATGTLAPPIVLFGDTLTARVDVVVDRSVVDPATVRVEWNPSPWGPVSPPRTTLDTAGSTAHLRTTWVLRCLTSVCAPVRETDRIDLDPARVTYTAPVGRSERELTQPVRWPTLIVHTRVGDLDPASRDALAAPWRADLVTIPAPSYRMAPWLLVALLVAAGVLLLVVAGVVVYRVWPRPQPEPEPEPEPEPVASLLEQALQLLERTDDEDGAEERRRALELVADEVEQVGEPALALDARALAWSSTAPAPGRTQELAAVLRVRLAHLLEVEEVEANGAEPAERTNGVPA